MLWEEMKFWKPGLFYNFLRCISLAAAMAASAAIIKLDFIVEIGS